MNRADTRAHAAVSLDLVQKGTSLSLEEPRASARARAIFPQSFSQKITHPRTYLRRPHEHIGEALPPNPDPDPDPDPDPHERERESERASETRVKKTPLLSRGANALEELEADELNALGRCHFQTISAISSVKAAKDTQHSF